MSDIADEIDLAHAGARVTGHGLDAWIAEARELLKLAWPLILTQLAQMAIMTTDVMMLGHYSGTALASAALGNIAFFFCWILGCGPVSAVSPMIAHILGANPNEREGVRDVVRMGFWAVLTISVPLIVFLLFVKHILLFLGQTEELASGAGVFVSVLCWGLPFSLGYQVLRNFATALSRPNASLVVMIVAIGFNAVGDYGLIFGHFGLPRLGVLGAGIASACSYAFSFFAMALVVWLTPALHRYHVFRDFTRLHIEKLGEVLRLGMPIGLTMMFEGTLFNASMLIMGTFGKAFVDAHQIALNVPSITFMVPLGLGMATTVRVGLAAGARDGEAVRRAGYSAMLIAIVFMSLTGILIWSFPVQIAGLYFSDMAANADVAVLVIVYLRVAAAFQIFDGLQVVSAMALRGLKDAQMPMWIAGASYWLAGFPACLWLAYDWHLNGLGVWIGLAFALLIAATAMTTRFWRLSRSR